MVRKNPISTFQGLVDPGFRLAKFSESSVDFRIVSAEQVIFSSHSGWDFSSQASFGRKPLVSGIILDSDTDLCVVRLAESRHNVLAHYRL